jgi:flagellar motility protein MotE (MotC chaperone)
MFTVFACLLFSGTSLLRVIAAAAEGTTAPKPAGETAKESGASAEQPLSASRAAREEKAIQDARRQQLAEKEAGLAAKEQELKKLGAKLDSQIKSLDDSKKRLDDSLKSQKKVQDEKQKKMIGLFKKMKPEQAGQLMDKLEEEKVISLLNQMDTKTVIKLIPYLKQPRVLKWIVENLKGA